MMKHHVVLAFNKMLITMLKTIACMDRYTAYIFPCMLKYKNFLNICLIKEARKCLLILNKFVCSQVYVGLK